MDEKKLTMILIINLKIHVSSLIKNKFLLLLRKDIYPYEYVDSWERFNETELPTKDKFYSNLTIEDITDKDYRCIM